MTRTVDTATNGTHASPHAPVMVHEVVDALVPCNGALYIDATFGAGGYSTALLEASDCSVIAIDRDPGAKAFADVLVKRFPGRLTLLTGAFGDMVALLGDIDVARVDGVAFDLGVSSMQLDQASRGFSFRADGPLDMRMGSDAEGLRSAADVVNSASERDLADIIFQFGEEKASRKVAKAIVDRRAENPFATTLDLAETVRSVVRPARDGIDPATRTFQALRIYVNDELGQLKAGLAAAETVLRDGGRLAVVSFHSLEDRIVKRFLAGRTGKARGSRHMPEPMDAAPPSFVPVSTKPIRPSAEETRVNPRARSAKLRVAARTNTPPASLPNGGVA